MGRTPEELLALATINPELDQVSTYFTLRLQIFIILDLEELPSHPAIGP